MTQAEMFATTQPVIAGLDHREAFVTREEE